MQLNKYKVCRECDKRLLLTEFYKHSQMVDGHLNKCKNCVKLRVKNYRRKNADAIRSYDRNRSKTTLRRAHSKRNLQRWRRQNPDKAKLSTDRYPEKRKARTAVSNAIRDGHLNKGACEVCGKTERVEAHHSDYSKPLEVQWLCPEHHSREKHET